MIMPGIDDIIVNIADKDFASAQNDLNALMADKVGERLDATRAMIAQDMAGTVQGSETHDDNFEIHNDDIELDDIELDDIEDDIELPDADNDEYLEVDEEE
jgi:hypothetical protein